MEINCSLPVLRSADRSNLPHGDFAAAPASWYHLASLEDLRKGPRKFDLPDQESFVGFCGTDGEPIVLSARCSHMGADLSQGCVRDGRLVCPLHGWEYNSKGACVRIPTSKEIPAFARQKSFPVAVRGGHVFFFNRMDARFPMPFFEDASPESLMAARPFDIWADLPWYMVGGNGFDLQHFELTHDRRLVREPQVEAPHPFARRGLWELEVAGRSFPDRLTRAFAGTRSQMTVTSWCGSLIFATAKFRRVETRGMLSVRPLPNWKTHATVIVWVRRTGGTWGSLVFDPLNAAIRRVFIRSFLQADLAPLSGVRYQPGRLIPADKMLADYLAWQLSVQ